jgi:hypothetical protein
MAGHQRPLCASMAKVVNEPLAAEVAVRTASASERAEAKRARRWVWVYELVVIGVGYWLYSLIRNSVTATEGESIRHADHVVRIEKALWLYHEHILNHFVARLDWLAYICNYYYATLHFIVTISVGIWVYRRHPQHARQLRNAWYLMNLLALIGFKYFPLAPPRLLPGGGYIDTVVKFHTWGSWGDQSVSSHSNLYAAMPSMHIGWSLWVAISVVFLARRWWVRLLGACYPLCTLFVIIGTGNHYWLDAVGGAAACLAAFAIVRVLGRRPILPRLRGRDATHPRPDATLRADDAARAELAPTGAAVSASHEVGQQRDDHVGQFLDRPVADSRQGDHADGRRVVDQP